MVSEGCGVLRICFGDDDETWKYWYCVSFEIGFLRGEDRQAVWSFLYSYVVFVLLMGLYTMGWWTPDGPKSMPTVICS